MNGFIFQEAGSHPFLRGRMQVLILFYREDAGSRPFLQGGSRFSSFSTGRTQVLVLFYREDAGSHPFLRGKTHISESYNSSVLNLSKFTYLFSIIYFFLHTYIKVQIYLKCRCGKYCNLCSVKPLYCSITTCNAHE